MCQVITLVVLPVVKSLRVPKWLFVLSSALLHLCGLRCSTEVLFYVDQDSVLKLWEDVFGFGGESLFCLVDSLKPAVTEYAHLHKQTGAASIPDIRD